MKNIINSSDRQEIISRIHQLTPDHKGQWGKMDVAQMLTHCQRPMELALTNPKPPRKLLGYILGPMAKNSVFGPKPYERNGYTPPEFKIADPQVFGENKEKLLKLIDRFPQEMPNAGLNHPFFGPLPLDV
ncbi:MAG: hypothetical protein JWO03_1010 [Bacteroidetes bacterium]|nr:hypothetical protein [Bacteroidota bacterium]